MKTSEKGITLIKHFEGLRLMAYQCAGNVWTIGYGHTTAVQPGNIITAEQADVYIRQDLVSSENAVNHCVSVLLNQNQFDALVSFTFNLGAGNFRKSTLLKNLNSGDYQGAADQLIRWVHAGGKKLPGLVARREAERELFLE